MRRAASHEDLPISETFVPGSQVGWDMGAHPAGARLASRGQLVLACTLTLPASILIERGRRPGRDRGA